MPGCICPEEGQGRAALGFERVKMEGGKLPSADLTDEEIVQQLDSERRDIPVQSDWINVTTQPIARGFLPDERGDNVVLCT